jgi:hypothetical protein
MVMQKARMRIGIAAGLLVAVFILPVTFSVKSQSRGGRSSWPKKEGVYIATSSETIPPFPRIMSGYRATGNKDYWGNPFSIRGTIRVFEGNDWEVISDFPKTMNGCSAGVFMMRWRSANPNVRIVSALGDHYANVIFMRKTGVFGYIQGHNCEEPMFKFIDSRDTSTLVDVYYELKFWQAAP